VSVRPARRGRAAVRRPRDPAARLRALCLGLDAVTETLSWGHPNFKAGGRIFATFEVVRGRPSIAVRVGDEFRDLLIDEQRFFRTPYGGNRGWVSAWVDGTPDWRLLARLVRRAHALARGGTRPAR